jgi:putative transposase
MARPPRQIIADDCYHGLNRGKGRMTLFHKHEDFVAFLNVLREGLEHYPVDLLCYCLMSNHWHLVLRPRKPAALANLMQWVGVTHVRRRHEPAAADICTRGGSRASRSRTTGNS